MVGQNHSQAVPNFLLWELSQGNLGVLQQRNPGNAAGIGDSKAQRASRTTQPRHWAVPRKHIAEGPQGAAGRGRARQRSSLLEGAAPSAPTFPARQRSLVIEIDWPIEREKVGRHGGHPSSFITNAARQRRPLSTGYPPGYLRAAQGFGLCPLFSGAGRRPVREVAPRQGSLPELRARRKPMLLLRLSGLLLLSRLETVQLSALLFQLPPRMRRLEVPSSPWPTPESGFAEHSCESGVSLPCWHTRP